MMLAGLCLVSAQAFAQWQWIGNDGRKVYSDRPPPSDIPAQNVLRQPGGSVPVAPSKASANRPTPTGMPAAPTGSPAARATTAPQYGDIKPAEAKAPVAASAPAAPASAAASKPAADKAAEQKAKQAEAAEAAKRKEIEAKNAAVQAENCRRANEAKASLSSGMRIAKLNDKGERIVLDDKARAEEMKRADDIIASECKK